EVRLDLLVAQHPLQILERRQKGALVLRAVGIVLGADPEQPRRLADEALEQRQPLADQLGVVREIEQRGVDLVADARDELAERRHLLGLNELDLRLLQARDRSRELLGASGNALLERLI